MKVVVYKGYFSKDTVEHWNNLAQSIEPVDGKTAFNKDTNTSIRSSQLRWVRFRDHPNTYNSIADDILQVVDAESLTFRTETYRALEIQHTTYNVNDHYVRHSDIDFNASGNNSAQRKISIVVQLSDESEYDGGELVIENNVIPKDIGTIILFPPYMFHKVEKVTRGVRKSLVVWVHGPAWR